MENTSHILIRSKEGDCIQFDQKIIALSKYIQNVPNKEDIIPAKNISTDTLQFLKKFLEAHNYDDSTMTWKFPFKSNNLEEHIDQISFDLLKDYSGQDLKENAIKLGPILECAFFLDIKPFKKITNVALQIPLYCGTTESDFAHFKEKYAISDENLTPEIQKKIMEENKPIFDKLKEEFKDKLQELEKKAAEELNQ